MAEATCKVAIGQVAQVPFSPSAQCVWPIDIAVRLHRRRDDRQVHLIQLSAMLDGVCLFDIIDGPNRKPYEVAVLGRPTLNHSKMVYSGRSGRAFVVQVVREAGGPQ